ncbi:MAG: TonB-dependent receptor [Bryobacterales bacterium]|nr:TonB-dependent receptor [Bryobacterales bacterium]
MRQYLLLLLLAVSPGLAQNAEITGRVADPAGAVVANAEVVVTNSGTGNLFPTVTNGQGYYTVRGLIPGTYQVRVSAVGFKPVLRSGVVLQVEQVARLDFALELGQVTEQIEVTGTPPLVESETSNLGQVINNKSILEMPLNGRNAWDLSKLSGATVFIRGVGDSGEIPIAAMAGGRTYSQSFLIDGGSTQKSALARAQAEVSPMVDAVEEFKVITNNYAAEYGRSAAGVFTAVTKSGTNQYRGNVFHFLRNNAMDARNTFALVQAPLRYNQFGGTFGGPIRKNRTHFFAALENTRVSRGDTTVLTVPTQNQRQGIFTGLVNAQGRPLQLYDPATTRPDPNNATLRLRDPFADNVIPTSRLDPVGVRAANFYPLPNQPGNVAGANNFNLNIPARRTQYHGTLRVDHVLSDKDRIFGRYIVQRNSLPFTSAFAEPASSGLGPNSRSISNLATTYMASWTRTISSSLLNDLKWNGTNQGRDITHPSVDQDWAGKLGLNGVGPRAFPRFLPGGYSAMGAANPYRLQTNPYWQLIDTLSWFRGNHSIKAGFEYRRNKTTDEFDTQPSGTFNFNLQGTGLQNNTLSGDGLASMLVGFVSQFTLVDSINFDFRNWYAGAFVQDDWKVTPRLTLNLGLRYDVETGRVSPDNTQNAFDMTRLHPTAQRPGLVTFAGTNGVPRSLFDTDRNNLSPRFGFAWRPLGGERTVVRGGFGVFFGNPDDQGFNNSAVLGFARQANLVSPDVNQTPAFLLRNGAPGVPASPPGAAQRSEAFGVNNAIDFYERNRATPYSMQYNFGVQQDMRGALVSAQYLANLGRKLTATGLSQNQVRPELVGGAGTVQSRRPFPHFTDVLVNSPNLGVSSYHALLVRGEKRYSNGFQFLVNYTFSKFLDNVDPIGNGDFGGTPGAGYQDFYNRRLDKALSPNDVRHAMNFNVIYEIPLFAKGSRLGRFLGGWQISTLAVIQSGPPFGVSTQQNTCECSSAGPQRPMILRDPTLASGERSTARWFDINAFAQPARFAFGNAARSVGRAPGLVNFDAGLMKNFAFSERFRLQLRGEAFNAINRANYGVPGLALGGPNFGAINSAADARILQVGAKLYF